MRPPPSRYRVIERGGRLIVIDNWAKGGETQLVERVATSRRPVSPPRHAPRGMMPPARDGLLPRLVRVATVGAVDPQGRPFWTTARWYDTKGPRSFALGRAGVQRLGHGLLGLMALALAALIGLFVIGFPMIVILGALVATLRNNFSTFVTNWVDRFEQLPPD
ncbi:MAG: hypothetical protein WC804_07800 [Sphingomonas sp.]|uniref:hypothetical protein n=1 Tax=Sphingomonas sp. TaxID=28214 RepID=UPI003562DD91